MLRPQAIDRRKKISEGRQSRMGSIAKLTRLFPRAQHEMKSAGRLIGR
jgi:hypothetical protein